MNLNCSAIQWLLEDLTDNFAGARSGMRQLANATFAMTTTVTTAVVAAMAQSPIGNFSLNQTVGELGVAASAAMQVNFKNNKSSFKLKTVRGIVIRFSWSRSQIWPL